MSFEQQDDASLSTWSFPVIVACGMGFGRIKPAPGTWGTVAAALIALVLCIFVPNWPLQLIFAILAGLSLLIGMKVVPQAQRAFGCEDPSEVVIDEWLGYWLCLACIPQDMLQQQGVLLCVVGFLAFRFFDIVKPWPIPMLERMRGAWGVMVDDAFAGLLAAIVTLVFVQ
ncbi:MAG: phosphatidylglycerophosphatase A [Planctomycetes bacterium]|nr:phosphatidylglycerophosphatase A [Planctomycetota bacterium]